MPIAFRTDVGEPGWLGEVGRHSAGRSTERAEGGRGGRRAVAGDGAAACGPAGRRPGVRRYSRLDRRRPAGNRATSCGAAGSRAAGSRAAGTRTTGSGTAGTRTTGSGTAGRRQARLRALCRRQAAIHPRGRRSRGLTAGPPSTSGRRRHGGGAHRRRPGRCGYRAATVDRSGSLRRRWRQLIRGDGGRPEGRGGPSGEATHVDRGGRFRLNRMCFT
jgi:hypothetical protein